MPHTLDNMPNGQESKFVRHFAFRLQPHNDLRQSVLQFAAPHKIKAGAIVTCVGSLEQINLRFANQQDGSKVQGFFEIISLAGTLSSSEAHLHLSVADNTGALFGGHLLTDNLVYTTAEIVIADLMDLNFIREPDASYGYRELVVKRASDEH